MLDQAFNQRKDAAMRIDGALPESGGVLLRIDWYAADKNMEFG